MSGLGPGYRKLWSASVVSNLGDGVAQIAYPWLASAVTRDPLLIAGVAVAQRLPWLIFSLPAGVVTDRADRRRLLTVTSALRAVLTLVVVVAIALADLPADVTDVVGTRVSLYLVLLVVSLLSGAAEVLYDNTAQTILPEIVEPAALERANGRLWAGEMVANSFLGPPLGGVLLAVAFTAPFVLDATSFAAAGLLLALVPGTFRAAEAPRGRIAWREELVEGVRWLWSHPLLRPMAVILGFMNALWTVAGATLVLFVQEVLGLDATGFAVLGVAGAVGGVVGGLVAPRVSHLLGSGPSLWTALVGGALVGVSVGTARHWWVVLVAYAGFGFVAVLWNVITVSLRQAIIPPSLLGRVNSVYRFLAWGMMPVGLLVGGALVAAGEGLRLGRTTALRVPYLVAAVGFLALLGYAMPRLTTERIESARSAADASEGDQDDGGQGGGDPEPLQGREPLSQEDAGEDERRDRVERSDDPDDGERTAMQGEEDERRGHRLEDAGGAGDPPGRPSDPKAPGACHDDAHEEADGDHPGGDEDPEPGIVVRPPEGDEERPEAEPGEPGEPDDRS